MSEEIIAALKAEDELQRANALTCLKGIERGYGPKHHWRSDRWRCEVCSLDTDYYIKALEELVADLRPWLDYVDLVGTRGIPGNGSRAAWNKRRKEDEKQEQAIDDACRRADSILS